MGEQAEPRQKGDRGGQNLVALESGQHQAQVKREQARDVDEQGLEIQETERTPRCMNGAEHHQEAEGDAKKATEQQLALGPAQLPCPCQPVSRG